MIKPIDTRIVNIRKPTQINATFDPLKPSGLGSKTPALATKRCTKPVSAVMRAAVATNWFFCGTSTCKIVVTLVTAWAGSNEAALCLSLPNRPSKLNVSPRASNWIDELILASDLDGNGEG